MKPELESPAPDLSRQSVGSDPVAVQAAVQDGIVFDGLSDLEKLQKAGLADQFGNLTDRGALEKRLVGQPIEAKNKARDLWSRDLIDSNLKLTEKGAVVKAGRSNALRNPELFLKRKQLGLEPPAPSLGFLETTFNVGKQLAKGTIPDAVKFANTVADVGRTGNPVEALKLARGSGEYAREAMREPVLIWEGLKYIANKKDPNKTLEEKVDAERRWKLRQEQLDELEGGEALSAGITALGVLAEAGAPITTTAGVAARRDFPAEAGDKARQGWDAVSMFLTPEQQERSDAEGAAGGELLGPFGIATEGATMGAGAGLKLGSASTSRLLRLEMELAEKQAKAAALREVAGSIEGIAQNGTKNARKAAVRTRTELLTQAEKAAEEAAQIGNRAKQMQASLTDAGVLGAAREKGRKILENTLGGSGKGAQWAGEALERIGDKFGDSVGAARMLAYSGTGALLGGWPGAAVGAVGSLVSGGKALRTLGEGLQAMGAGYATRKGTLPYWRKVANHLNDSKLAWLAGAAESVAKPINATGKLGAAAARGMSAEVPFSYLASGGEGDWLAEGVGEALVFGPAGKAGNKVYGRLSEMSGAPAIGTPRDFALAAMADAANLRKILPTDGQKAAFDALPTDLQRALGVYTATYPDLSVRIDSEAPASSYDGGSRTMVIKPDSTNPLAPLVAHEVKHHIHSLGLKNAIVGELVGPGGLFRDKDGSLTKEFSDFKAEYEKRKGSEISEEDAALEYAADSFAGYLDRSMRSGTMQRRGRRDPMARAAVVAALDVGNFSRSLLEKMGVTFSRKGQPVISKGAMGMDLKQSPAIKALLEDHMRRNAGRRQNPEQAARNEKRAQVRVMEPKPYMISQFKEGPDGNALTDEAGRLIPLTREEITAREQAGEKAREMMGPLQDKQARNPEGATYVLEDDQGQKALTPEGWEQVLGKFKKEGVLSSGQLMTLESVVDGMKNNAGVPILTSYQKVYKTLRSGKKVVPRGGFEAQFRVGIPYGIGITNKGNILIQLIDRDALSNNVQRAANSPLGKKLYGGDTAAVWADVQRMADNHAKGRMNMADPRLGNEEKLNFVNAIFGDVGRGHKDANPKVSGRPRMANTVRSFRLDRVNRSRPVHNLPKIPVVWESIRDRLLPEPAK